MSANRTSRRLSGHTGMTLIELCIVIVILGILLTVAVAALTHARVAANEASAIATLRTITKAEFAYASECGRGFYAESLTQLGAARPGRSQGFLNEDVGLVNFPERNGYRFNVHAGNGAIPGLEDCNKVGTQTTYYASAIPVAPERTGTRSFATSQSNAIWQQFGTVPPPEPFGAPSEYVR
jgi:prepilin-type N-terminal cleavage/methylation domain-containing protein